MSTSPPVLDGTVLLADATARLVRTVDTLTDPELAAPSTLPGWSRAHVVAHLALNAEGLAAALVGVASGEAVPMYRSQEARDTDIDELAGAGSAELRHRSLASTTRFTDAAATVPEQRWDDTFERTPGGQAIRARATLALRWREVEIHHVDLDAGYQRTDWPLPFSVMAIDTLTGDGRSFPTSFRMLARDAARTWQVGDGATQTVTGDAAALAWWLSGRVPDGSLVTDRGDLPEVPSW